MALNVISNLAPVLVPVVVKLIDNFFSTDGTTTPPEIREKRQRNLCHCKNKDEDYRCNVNQCSKCGKPYSKFTVRYKQHLNLPTDKLRSMSSGDSSYDDNNKMVKKCNRRGRSLSDSCQKRITDDDTLMELGRRLEKEAMKANSINNKLSSYREYKKTGKKSDAVIASTSSSKKF